VFNVFPSYNNHNAGYNWEWDTSGYSIGEHEIFARYVDNAGNVVDVGRRKVRIEGERDCQVFCGGGLFHIDTDTPL